MEHISIGLKVSDSCTYESRSVVRVCRSWRQAADGRDGKGYDGFCVYFRYLRFAFVGQMLFQKEGYVHQHFVPVWVSCYVDIFGCRTVLGYSLANLYRLIAGDSWFLDWFRIHTRFVESVKHRVAKGYCILCIWCVLHTLVLNIAQFALHMINVRCYRIVRIRHSCHICCQVVWVSFCSKLCMVLVALNAMCTLVWLNKLVIFRTYGP
jgi:hypothetical protein